MKVHAEEIFNCSAEEYWQRFFDEDYRRGEQLDSGAASYRVLKQEVRGDEVRQVVELVEKTGAPGPIKKLFGDETRLEEEAVWQQGSHVARLKYTPEKMADRIHMTGELRTQPLGDDKCKVVMSYDVEFKMFGVGGMVEKMIAKDLPEHHRKAAVYHNSHPYDKK